MKIIAIGDTHGRDNWKKIVKQDFDKVIFIGDYFDSFDVEFKYQLQNFKEILELKKDNVDKVVLLIGNHDYHYIIPNEHYSGYQEYYCDTIANVLDDAIEAGLMQMCSLDAGFLFTHAGVTKTWAKNSNIDLSRIEGSINKCFMFTAQMFKFLDYKNADLSGDNIYQSPIWVRPHSLVEDMIDGYYQIVGHTQMRNLILNNEKKVGFIDCLGKSGEYLEIINGVPNQRK